MYTQAHAPRWEKENKKKNEPCSKRERERECAFIKQNSSGNDKGNGMATTVINGNKQKSVEKY